MESLIDMILDPGPYILGAQSLIIGHSVQRVYIPPSISEPTFLSYHRMINPHCGH